MTKVDYEYSKVLIKKEKFIEIREEFKKKTGFDPNVVSNNQFVEAGLKLLFESYSKK